MMPRVTFTPTSAPDAARIAHARWGVMGLFLAMGILLSTFLARIPTVRDELHVDKGQLATLLIFGAGGAFVALLLTGWAAARYGTRALLVWSTITYTLAFVGVGLASHYGSHEFFAAAQFLTSFSFAFTNVSMNAEAAAVERHVGRKIMPQFHAAFSAGMALGLAIGWVFSHYGVPPVWHFASLALALAAVRLALVPAATIDGRPVSATAGRALGGPFATAKAEYRDRRVLMIGLIIFAASMTEGAAAQWISLATVDDFGQPESTGVAMYWVFVVAMVTIRSLGAFLLERFGRVVMLRASAASVMAGIALFAFSPTFGLAPVALLLWGVGAALGVPIGFSAAADEPGRAAARVAAVSSFATLAGVAIPPVIGHLAEGLGSVRHALLLVILASLTSWVLARAVRKDERLFLGRRRRRSARAGAAPETAITLGATDTGTTLGA